MSDAVSTVDVLALVIASIAAVLAVWSLGWHLQTRRQGRAKLKVSDGHGMVLGADGGEMVVIVRAENIGPLPIGVMGWGFRFRRGRVHIPATQLPASPDVPLVLRPGEDANFFVPLSEFERAVEEMGSSSVRPFVTVAASTIMCARHWARPAEVITIADGDHTASGSPRSSMST